MDEVLLKGNCHLLSEYWLLKVGSLELGMPITQHILWWLSFATIFYSLDYKEIFVQAAMMSLVLHLAQIDHLGIKWVCSLIN